MKLIKVTPELKISAHDFPDGKFDEQNKALSGLIGGGCAYCEEVLPRRLYHTLHFGAYPIRPQGMAVSMLVDEDFMRHEEQRLNPIGSWLYQTDVHGAPICGTVLFVGRAGHGDGVGYCGIHPAVFQPLQNSLQECRETLIHWNGFCKNGKPVFPEVFPDGVPLPKGPKM